MKDNQNADLTQKGAANYNAYLRLRDNGHSDWVKSANRNTAFYLGYKWSDEDVNRMDEEGRPAITVNAKLSTVNTHIG